MTPLEWTNALAPEKDWKSKWASITVGVREFLEGLPDGKLIGTRELIEAIWPEASVRGPDMIYARNYLASVLVKKGYRSLDNCRTKDHSNSKRYYGRVVIPWLWHKPEHKAKRCPHCGGILEDGHEAA